MAETEKFKNLSIEYETYTQNLEQKLKTIEKEKPDLLK